MVKLAPPHLRPGRLVDLPATPLQPLERRFERGVVEAELQPNTRDDWAPPNSFFIVGACGESLNSRSEGFKRERGLITF